jgi:hypothetical protein
MNRAVMVAFGGAKQYRFHVLDSELSEATETQANFWLDQQWDALGCEPVRPSGKVLLLDKILGVARAAGDKRFADNGPWAHGFARNVARLLDRPVIVVDVAEHRVG